jgi:hypothetical protein
VIWRHQKLVWHILYWRGCKEWVESSSRPALKECSPPLLILDKKDIGMKFKENIIISSNAMNRSNFFGCLRDMKYII